MTRRIYPIAAVLACALFAVGAVACGGSTRAGVSGESGAALVHSGSLAYVAIDSDLDSAQWRQVDELLHKFPGRDKWIAELERDLPDDIQYNRDIGPALGPEVDVAVVADPGAGAAVAVLTKPDSLDKARELVRKLSSQDDKPPATRVVDGWFVVAETEAMIDRVLKGSATDSLADDPTFKAAMEELPSDAIAKAYVNGRQLGEFADRLLGSGAQKTAFGAAAPYGLDKLDWGAAALLAKGDGIRFEAGAKGESASRLLGSGASYASKLISGVPADSFAFLTFQGSGLRAQLEGLRANPAFAQGFREIEQKLGMSLDEVLGLLSHEVAFYARPGAGLPEFTLVLESPDTQSALTTLDRLANRAAQLLHGKRGQDREDGLPVETLTVPPVTVRWTAFDGRVLLTTGPTGITDYRSSGPKLADDDGYKHALDVAGAPDETGGLVYVDLQDGLQVLKSYLGISSEKLPPDVAANLKPLQSFVAYNTTSGDLTKLVAFLEIK